MTFYHYTCEHGRQALGDVGVVLPLHFWAPEAADQLPLAHHWLAEVTWWTDLDSANRYQLGLTSHVMNLACDRMSYRYRALDTSHMLRWVEVARGLAPRVDIRALNGNTDALPMHWFVAAVPVKAEFDPTYKGIS